MARKPTIQDNNHQTRVAQTTQKTAFYQGAIPPPDMLEALDKLVPGTAERLIKLAEQESIHRRDQEAKALEANIRSQNYQYSIAEIQLKSVFRSDALGQILGFIVCLVCIISATYLAFHDKEVLAVAIAAIPTGALLKAFAISKK